MKYIPSIGLEVHAQLSTQTKLFCGCKNTFGAEANHYCCPICLGMPGALPVLNKTAVSFAIRAGLALGCEIHFRSIFGRKNYFYPDLPKGYQISQHDQPLCTEGHLDVSRGQETLRVGIERIHMEEDAGKSIHEDHRLNHMGSLVDLNRAGVPLIEIVSKPDLNSGQEASAYLKKLRSILRYIGVCNGNMEEGSLRCDANVSIRPEHTDQLGQKVEVKNMNSFKHVQSAIEYEIERQTQALNARELIASETRLWNAHKNLTFSMRSKEEMQDYRYFPEPDLKPLAVDENWIRKEREQMGELPEARKQRYISDFELPEYDAEVLTAEQELADFFETTLETLPKEKGVFKQTSNWVMGEVLRISKESSCAVDELKFKAKDLSGLIKLVLDQTISGKIAKDILEIMAQSGDTAEQIVEKRGLKQLSTPEQIEPFVQEVIEKNPKQYQQYKEGKDKLFGFFVGQVMKATQGKANPDLLNKMLKEKL